MQRPEFPSEHPHLVPFALPAALSDVPFIPQRARATRPFQFASLDDLDSEARQAFAYAKNVEGLRDATLRWWSGSFRLFRRYLVETDHVRMFLRGEPDAQGRVLEGWIAWNRSRGVQHGAVRAYWRGVLALFDRFTRMHGVWNPLRQFRTPRANPPLPRCLPKETVEGVLVYLRNATGPAFRVQRDLAIVTCMLLAGLRRAEVIDLKTAHVNRLARTIRIERGKGRDGGKSRIAYMPPQLVTILAAYDAEREAMQRSVAEPYFITARGAAIKDGAIRRLFARIRLKTGVHVSPHMLRHTYVTLLRQAGIADRLTMDLAGHSSLAMTQRYSGVFSGEHLVAADQLRLDVDLDASDPALDEKTHNTRAVS
jgi:integrase/recombinase XerC